MSFSLLRTESEKLASIMFVAAGAAILQIVLGLLSYSLLGGHI
jgi:hypothetical protein